MPTKTAPCGSTVQIVSVVPLRFRYPLTKWCKSGNIRTAITFDDIDVVCANCTESKADVVVTATLPVTVGSRRTAPEQSTEPEKAWSRVEEDSSLRAALRGWAAATRERQEASGTEGPTRVVRSKTPRELLASIGIIMDGSPVGRSRLRTFRECLFKGYLRYIIGLERQYPPSRDGKVSALDLGSLVHACLQRYYESANVWQPVEILEDQHPTLAAEARRLIGEYIRRFNEPEIREWDVRGTEVESRYYYPARKCAGKRRRLCVTTRHDTIYRSRKPGQRCLDPGVPAEGGLLLHEIKTTAHLSGLFLKGYRLDEQVLIGIAAFNLGQAVDFAKDGTPIVYEEANADLFGRAEGITLSIIGKNKDFNPAEHLARFTVLPSEKQLERYLRTTSDWLYSELGERFFSAHRDDPDTWPPSWSCRNPITGALCPYLEICELCGKWEGQPDFSRTGSVIQAIDFELQGKLERFQRRRRRVLKAGQD